MKEEQSRLKTIFRVSMIAILVNALIAVAKLIVGSLSKSVAIVSDGVNNFTDAGSSVITIAGAFLAAKAPDKKHPFGYGRVEYLASLAISLVILYAGVTTLVESVKAIISQEPSNYSYLTLIILGVSLLFKIGIAVTSYITGKKVDSDSLTSSGKEAMFDVAISVSTIVAAIIFMTTGFGIEAYLGVLISLFIVKAGISSLLETASKIIGKPMHADLVSQIKSFVAGIEGVNGAYDLVLNNYGHDKYIASIHVEVDEDMTAMEIDGLTREIVDKVKEKFGINLVAVGVYSKNKTNQFISEKHAEIAAIIKKHKDIKSMHGFYFSEESHKSRFDIVVGYESRNNRADVYDKVLKETMELFPDYDIQIALDPDFTEEKE